MMSKVVQLLSAGVKCPRRSGAIDYDFWSGKCIQVWDMWQCISQGNSTKRPQVVEPSWSAGTIGALRNLLINPKVISKIVIFFGDGTKRYSLPENLMTVTH
jgi:hypothetical protein